jgi:spermidine/putrescine-binding protein
MTKLILNRRRFIGTTAMASVALASPAYLRRTSAQGSGEVNIWTYNDFVPQSFKEQFEADTGIKVNIRLVDGAISTQASPKVIGRLSMVKNGVRQSSRVWKFYPTIRILFRKKKR